MPEALEEDQLTSATVVSPATALPSATGAPSLSTTTGAGQRDRLQTPDDALDLDEVRRTRVFAFFAACSAAPFAVFVTMMAFGDPTAKTLHIAGLCIFIVYYLAIAVRLRHADRVAPWIIASLGQVGLVTIGTGMYYWGRFAPILLIVPIALYTFALGRSRGAVVSVVATAVLIHATLTILAVTDVVPDVGILDPKGLTTWQDVSIAAYVWFILIAVVVIGRKRRLASQEILARLDRAVRDSSAREALLNEARLELDRALVPGGPGRFTGQELDGYTLGALLGIGAIGEVYEATSADDSSADHEVVAVKVLGRAALRKTSLVQRFYRELDIASRLETAHIVKVLAISSIDSPIPYLVMERLNGETLGEILRHRRRLPMADTYTLLRHVCAGVSVAHKAGIVHRDLKPHNLFLHSPSGGSPIWKVLDFGVSKLLDDGNLTIDAVVGTPTYMSPEQARSRDIDARSDIFALGAIAYRCLTGRPAFSGPDVPAILNMVSHRMPDMPSRIARLSRSMDAVLAIALAKDRADRFATVDEFLTAFESAAADEISPPLDSRAEAILKRTPWGG